MRKFARFAFLTQLIFERHTLPFHSVINNKSTLKCFIEDFDEPLTRGYNRGSHKRFKESPERVTGVQQRRKRKATETSEEEEDGNANASQRRAMQSTSEAICISSDSGASDDDDSTPKSGNGKRYFDANAEKAEEQKRTQQVEKAEGEEIREEESSVGDEGIGTAESHVVDLTSDKEEEETKTATLDQAKKKLILKRLMEMKKAKEEEMSEDESDESDESDEEDDSSNEEEEDGGMVPRANGVDRLFIRRNKNVEAPKSNAEHVVVTCPMPKDAISPTHVYAQMIGSEDDESDDETPTPISQMPPMKKIKLPPPRPT